MGNGTHEILKMLNMYSIGGYYHEIFSNFAYVVVFLSMFPLARSFACGCGCSVFSVGDMWTMMPPENYRLHYATTSLIQPGIGMVRQALRRK